MVAQPRATVLVNSSTKKGKDASITSILSSHSPFLKYLTSKNALTRFETLGSPLNLASIGLAWTVRSKISQYCSSKASLTPFVICRRSAMASRDLGEPKETRANLRSKSGALRMRALACSTGGEVVLQLFLRGCGSFESFEELATGPKST